jgi:hypothetical protein
VPAVELREGGVDGPADLGGRFYPDDEDLGNRRRQAVVCRHHCVDPGADRRGCIGVLDRDDDQALRRPGLR